MKPLSVLVAFALGASAAELEIPYSTLERIIAATPEPAWSLVMQTTSLMLLLTQPPVGLTPFSHKTHNFCCGPPTAKLNVNGK
jgi:hypothetical protein